MFFSPIVQSAVISVYGRPGLASTLKNTPQPRRITPHRRPPRSGLAPDLHWAPAACPPWRVSSWNRCLLLLVPAPGRLRVGTATDLEAAALGEQSCLDPPLEALAWSRLLWLRILCTTRPQPPCASRSRTASSEDAVKRRCSESFHGVEGDLLCHFLAGRLPFGGFRETSTMQSLLDSLTPRVIVRLRGEVSPHPRRQPDSLPSTDTGSNLWILPSSSSLLSKRETVQSFIAS